MPPKHVTLHETHNKGVAEKESFKQSQKYSMGGDIKKAPKQLEHLEEEVADWQVAMGSKPMPIEDETPHEPVPEVVAVNKSFTQLKLAYLTQQQATEVSISSDSELCAHALMWRHANTRHGQLMYEPSEITNFQFLRVKERSSKSNVGESLE